MGSFLHRVFKPLLSCCSHNACAAPRCTRLCTRIGCGLRVLLSVGLSVLVAGSGLSLRGWSQAQDIPENVSDLPAVKEVRPWQPEVDDPVPQLAYYYIWFDASSWSRAKSDYPLLGRYSSDDRAVMEQHVRWAKEAGIDGFIVSWKSTLKLDRRLEQLMDVAAQESFYLWIIYQGLDFDRNPLELDLIGNDLSFFLERYAEHTAFKMYDRPVIIWSGTWKFSPRDVGRITEGFRDYFYMLATERSVEGYARLAEVVDGNAYYWSSVNPDTIAAYEEKLAALGEAVHKNGGLWVAPAAPGFDARLVGGATLVERQGGATLRRQLTAALASSPDVVGLISWNEFSENTHIEPSQRYGTVALDSLADRKISVVPQILDFDSSAPGSTDRSNFFGLYVVIGLAVSIAVSVGLTTLRVRRERPLAGRSR